MRLILFLVVLACFTAMASAAPRVPADDGEVLQALPYKRGDPVAREMASLRTVLSREPRHVEAATRLASLQLQTARRQSDARLLGQAQATLAPWWSDPEPPWNILLLRATLRQSNHEFGAALDDLSNAVRRNPGAAQAWLTLATVQQVTGDLEAARRSCRRLGELAAPLVAITCLASVDGASGQAHSAYRALDAALRTSGRQPESVQVWALTLKAELAERLSLPDKAETAFREARAVDPSDTYTAAAYADFLLDRGRPADAIRLFDASPSALPDPLLLRYVLAARASGARDAEAAATLLGTRLEAARARGDRIHLREEARYLLHVRGDAPAALKVASENWAIQKEPADARLLREAKVAAGDKAAP